MSSGGSRAVLRALDDKIDSNRRLAGSLEETAAALFRARFVDFVGVEEFDDTELGPIPHGWSAGSLADLARFVNGKAFTKHANGLGRPIVRIRELNSGVDAGTPRSDLDADEDFIARSDDILFAWSGSLGVHRWHGEEALINQHIFKVLPDSCPSWFVYAWIQKSTWKRFGRSPGTRPQRWGTSSDDTSSKPSCPSQSITLYERPTESSGRSTGSAPCSSAR